MNKTENNTGTEINRNCFIITPIGPANSEIRRMADGVILSAIRPIVEKMGFNVITPHEMSDPGSIEHRIIHHILNSELVIANLTGLNPNVMYELAVRHSFGKPVVCIAEKSTILPFDINSQRVILYTNDMYGVSELCETLPNFINDALNKDPLNPIINVVSDIKTYEHASDAQKSILNKLEALVSMIRPNSQEPKNTYRKDRSNGMTTFYICTESDAKEYNLLDRGYRLVVSNTKFLDGNPQF